MAVTEGEGMGDRARYLGVAFLTLGLSLLLTLAWWVYIRWSVETYDRARFDEAVEVTRFAVADRIEDYVGILKGVRGLFRASERVERHEFEAYVAGIQVPGRFAFRGIGYAERVPRARREEHVAAVRSDGFGGYRIWPDPGEADAYPVRYLEPAGERIARALGFDQASEPRRRAAILAAIDADAAIMTDRIRFVLNVPPEEGFLIYLPVFRNGAPCRTVEERRAAALGLVFGAFNVGDVVADLFRGQTGRAFDFEIYDSPEVDPEHLVHDENGVLHSTDPSHHPRFAATARIEVAGRTWSLYAATRKAFDVDTYRVRPFVVIFFGLTVSLLLFFLTLTQARAHRAARRSERALRESEERLARAEATSRIMTFHVDLEGRFKSVPRTFCDLLGYTEEELLAKTFQEITHPADRAMSARVAERFRRGEVRSYEFEKRYVRKDGAVVWCDVTVTVVTDARGRAFENLTHVRDITERKRIEEARARLTAIIEATTDLASTFDAEGRILYLNGAGRKLTGLDETGGGADLALADLFPDWALKTIYDDGIPTAIRQGGWQGELALRRRDGSEIPVSQVILAHKGPDGTIEFFSTIARDVSERRHLEEQIRQAQKLEAIGRLAGGVAHDFNNLLTAVSGGAEHILRRLDPASPLRKDAEEILRVTATAASLTRHLLAFSRRQRLELSVLDLNAVIDGMIPMLRRLIGDDIQLVTVPGASLGTIRADPGRIEQVILNLAVNSRDAMPQGGELRIETANVDLGEAYAREHLDVRPGRFIVLRVGDTGCGMDQATRSRIFEPFFTTKEPGRGTGLGLSTVYGIVEQSGGHIEVTSEPGRGATFEIYLPCCDAAATASEPVEPAAPAPAAPSGRRTVLLVEDNDEVRTVVLGMLEDAGHDVLEAGGAEAALEICARHPGEIDLLLTDVTMPRMSGPALVARVKDLRPAIRVVYMSGHATDAAVHRQVLEGRATLIDKPFTFEQLSTTLVEVFAGEAAAPARGIPVQ